MILERNLNERASNGKRQSIRGESPNYAFRFPDSLIARWKRVEQRAAFAECQRESERARDVSPPQRVFFLACWNIISGGRARAVNHSARVKIKGTSPGYRTRSKITRRKLQASGGSRRSPAETRRTRLKIVGARMRARFPEPLGFTKIVYAERAASPKTSADSPTQVIDANR